MFYKTSFEGFCGESNLKNDLWLVVQPIESTYFYPQVGPLPKDKKGNWHGIAYVGVSEGQNIGEEFLVFIMATNSSASKVFSDYLNDSKNQGAWEGLQTLPDGAISIDSVKVIRK